MTPPGRSLNTQKECVMTKITNVMIPTPHGGKNEIKEDLSDLIYEISPEATPGMQAIGTRDVTQPNFDWLVQSLPSASGTGVLEGDVISRQASTGTTRRSNQCVILTRNATITGTTMASETAGYADALAHQMQLIVRGLKTDLETVLFAKTARTPGMPPRSERPPVFHLADLKQVLGTAGSRPSPPEMVLIPSPTAPKGFAKAHINSAMQQFSATPAKNPQSSYADPLTRPRLGPLMSPQPT